MSARESLLIVTQVMDERDPVLGFFVDWVRRLARDTTRHFIIACWKKGELTDLPSNIEVIALPKGAWRRVCALSLLSWKRRHEIVSVFVHMVPPVAVALGPLWRLLRMRIVLWYTHGTVSWSLVVATWFVHSIATATDETCRINSPKKQVLGHGIDLGLYQPGSVKRQPILLAVGRVAPRKNQMALIALCERIHTRRPDLCFICRIIGGPRMEEDRAYLAELERVVHEKRLESIVLFEGSQVGERVRAAFRTAACYVSVSLTGGLDKVVLEAMASKTPVLALGQTYRHLPGVHVAASSWTEEDVDFVLQALVERPAVAAAREWVMHHANVETLVKRLGALLFSYVRH
ncbi:MAG: glycosyltransferase [bacterium]|nr:glycosyltransferase [bacterium]